MVSIGAVGVICWKIHRSDRYQRLPVAPRHGSCSYGLLVAPLRVNRTSSAARLCGKAAALASTLALALPGDHS